MVGSIEVVVGVLKEWTRMEAEADPQQIKCTTWREKQVEMGESEYQKEEKEEEEGKRKGEGKGGEGGGGRN